MLDAALAFMHAGYSVIPASTDGTKAPLGQWKRFQTERADYAQIVEWFSNGHPGMGVVCGSVSGNLEMLEFEGRAMSEGYFGQWQEAMLNAGLGDLLSQLVTGYIEQSPSGGMHFFYRSTVAVKRNTKLASREATIDELTDHEREVLERTGRLPPRVLIETRGEGGYVVVAPSHGPVHGSGLPWTVLYGTPATAPVVAVDKIESLHAVCHTLNSYTHVIDNMPVPQQQQPTDELTPGEDFNIRGDWRDVLEPHGWRIDHVVGAATYWTRPGKDQGVSAVTGGDNGDNFYAWTTSSELPDQTALSKWRTFAILNCGGDFSRAAGELRKRGFGGQRPTGYHGSSSDQTDWSLLSQGIIRNGTSSGFGNQSGQAAALDDDDEWFWSSRYELSHVRSFARSRKAAPYAVLANVLVRVISAVGHQVKLPSIIYGKGSLNLFIAIVGEPGKGKDGAHDVAVECVDIVDVAKEEPIGSGEGIAATFVKPPLKRPKKIEDMTAEELLASDGPVWRTHSAIFQISEVGTLAALASRNGATLIEELNKVYAGQRLGYANRAAETRLPVPSHEYRACLVMNVQPNVADVLLSNDDRGFPQRFMFVDTVDPQRKRGRVNGGPEPIQWRVPDSLHPGKQGNPEDIILNVCDSVQDEIIENDDLVHADDPRGIAGHHFLTRLKLAAGLAIFNGRDDVSADDWKLATHLMMKSQRVLSSLESEKIKRLGAATKARALAEAERDAIKENKRAADKMKRVTKLIESKLSNGPLSHSELRVMLHKNNRDVYDEVIAALINTGRISSEKFTRPNGQEGIKYKLISSN